MQTKQTPPMVTALLKTAVAEKGQSGVARETGLTQPAISRYLQGIGEPTTKTLRVLADYFGVSVSVLRGEGLVTEKTLFDAVGMGFNEDVSAFEKYAYFTQTQFEWAFDEKETFFSGNIHYLHNMAEKAKELLKLPESFYSNINSGVWETLKHNAQKVIEKYHKMLETADDETKAFFLEGAVWQTIRGSFYDLVTTPDYFTRLTATFDSILSLTLKSKQAQQNRLFLAVAVSLAKLLRDIPSELSNIYDHEYMQDLQKLARTVINNSEHIMERWTPPIAGKATKGIDSDYLMERWAPPSITPKLKQQPVEESSQEHKPKPKASNKKAKP